MKQSRSKPWPEPLFVSYTDLRGGDVLLTYGNSARTKDWWFGLSRLIAFFSRGRFSHAAVFTFSADVLEAFDELVGYTILETGFATLPGRGRHRLMRIPHDPIRAEIWRHPECTLSSTDFMERGFGAMQELYGTNYSRYVRLVRLIRRLKILWPLVWLFAKGLDWIDRKKPHVPGAFCSELVARFYKHLDLELFDASISPEFVSPNDLVHSKLRRVDSILIPASALADYVPEPRNLERERMAKERIETMNFYRSFNQRFGRP